MNATLSPQSQSSQDRLVEKLPTPFFHVAIHDPALAIALHALVDLAQDGCFREALTLAAAIETRLKLLTITQRQ